MSNKYLSISLIIISLFFWGCDYINLKNLGQEEEETQEVEVPIAKVGNSI
ncbi:MAG: peptidyl-prolyl cis-trans isomerase, partial [Bacteroidetes bacterium]